MPFKVLAVGDVVGRTGLDFLSSNLRRLKKDEGIDFTIVNGENADLSGITPSQADEIFSAGADVITLGNHTFSRRQILDYLDDNRYILRPANYAPQAPGRGYGVFESRCGDVCVINLIGRCSMAFGPDSPFFEADRILGAADAKFVFVDFHAEATSEKTAMAHFLDGRVTGVFGTHTHVQTSDGEVFPKGTGYITDVGMTGARFSVIGISPEISVSSFCGDPPRRYEDAGGAGKLECAVFTADEKSGKCLSVKTMRII